VKVDLFDYELPEHLIAQRPLEKRDECRLLVLDPKEGAIAHKLFSDLPSLLSPGDLLILNDTKVLRARIPARKKGSGGHVELLLLEGEGKRFKALARGRRIREGTELEIGDGSVDVRVLGRDREGNWVLEASSTYEEIMKGFGKVPLPPYIKSQDIPEEGYQTVYAKREGSIAAPTAGLHFTEDLLERIKGMGVGIGFITLHVGPGTFKLVRSERVEDHSMEYEWFEVPEETAELIRKAKEEGKRTIAVGTTVVRALESRASSDGTVIPGCGRTNMFIYPGYRFKVVDGMITNFHLPRSTPLILVCAFAGRDMILRAYEEAIEKGYRFYSFGDAMFITGRAEGYGVLDNGEEGKGEVWDHQG
jgi:S-adenosylmethionine:tRNA ribosyltransferase-isomerase